MPAAKSSAASLEETPRPAVLVDGVLDPLQCRHGFRRVAGDGPLIGPAAAPAPQVVLQGPACVAGQGRVDVGVLRPGTGLQLRRPLGELLPGGGRPVRKPGGFEVVLVVVEQRGGTAVGERPLLVLVFVVVHQRLLEVVDFDVQLLHQAIDGDDAAVGEVAEPPHIGEDYQPGQACLSCLGRLELLGNFLVVGAGRHQVDLDVRVLGVELLDDRLLHVLGLAGVVGPEIDGGGGLYTAEVDRCGVDGVCRARRRRSAACGEGRGSGSEACQSQEMAAVKVAAHGVSSQYVTSMRMVRLEKFSR